MLEVKIVPVLADNYAYLLRCRKSGVVACIDPGAAAPILAAWHETNWGRLDFVLNTHHHSDHIGGNAEIIKATKAKLLIPAGESGRIPNSDLRVEEGQHWQMGAQTAQIIEIPGHTSGHIAFYFAEAGLGNGVDDITGGALFCGDTLFALGCGRLFEGTPAQMWQSLLKLRALPPTTRVYCGHEYTLANGEFAADFEPDNRDLAKYITAAKAKRASGQPTIPSLLGDEIKCNPFLRVDQPEFCAGLAMAEAEKTDPVAVLAWLRQQKNHWKGKV